MFPRRRYWPLRALPVCRVEDEHTATDVSRRGRRTMRAVMSGPLASLRRLRADHTIGGASPEVAVSAHRWALVGAGVFVLLVMTPSACGRAAQPIEIAVGAADEPYPFRFVASGSAVDAGLVCPAGDVDEAAARYSIEIGTVAESTFICDDGSGSFVIQTVIEDDPEFEGEGLPVSPWTVTSGSGSYERLQGQGTHRFLPAEDVHAKRPLTAVVQLITGEVSRG